MVEYFGVDLAQTYHALNVYSLARVIGLKEGLDEHKMQILECAAVLHDIGKPESLRIYRSTVGKYQEIMGRKVGSELMASLGYPQDVIQAVCFLIGNHHSYDVDGGPSLQILIEANMLARFQRAGRDRQALEEIRRQYFRTQTGSELYTTMFSLPYPLGATMYQNEAEEPLPFGLVRP